MANQGEQRKLELTYMCAPFVLVIAPRQLLSRSLELTYMAAPYVADKPPVRKVVIIS